MQIGTTPWTVTTSTTATPRTAASRDVWKPLLIAVMAITSVYVSQRHRIARLVCPVKVPAARADIDVMSPEELMTYLSWIDPKTSCRIKQNFGGELSTWPHVINGPDGHKQVCMDPGVRPGHNCTVYSFGIEKDDWSFEESVQLLGCEIHVFDAKLNYPDFDRTPQIHFHKLSISHEDSNDGWKARTLKSIHQMLTPQHAPIDYVKIDIQSNEWLIISNIIDSGVLDDIKQLAIELHFDKNQPDLMMVRAYLSLIKDLEMHGMIRFASRPNYNKIGPLMGKKRHTVHELVWFNPTFRQ